MRRLILAIMLVGFAGSAFAADDKKKPAGAVKGAAVGAVAGHEVGSGHAVAGAATGAAIGHHQSKKAEESKSQYMHHSVPAVFAAAHGLVYTGHVCVPRGKR